VLLLLLLLLLSAVMLLMLLLSKHSMALVGILAAAVSANYTMCSLACASRAALLG
jgi:hypothetical protein